MKANDKIVFMDGLFPAILFPVGKPEDGGTCAFMTDHCQTYCPMRTTNIHEQRALKYFQDNSIDIIVSKIISELSELSIVHLYWWSWGDCLPEMTDKIIQIMENLHGRGLIQNGFTRNFALFEKIHNKSHRDRLRIGYHAETPEEAEKLSVSYYPSIFCCPDVDRGKGVLYFSGNVVAECCGIWCEWIECNEIRIADCQECYLYRKGCFTVGTI